LLYVDSHKGEFPKVHAGQESWVYDLAPFVEGVNIVRVCPDDPLGNERLGAKGIGTSYVINEYVTIETDDLRSVLNIHKMKQTSKTIIVFEGADMRQANNEHAHASLWYTERNITKNLWWPQYLSEVKPDRHGESSNYLFADGHVETIAEEMVYQWMERDVQQGTNFAIPVTE
jgi:prepilin-type processing-associated H-X9-DG protein